MSTPRLLINGKEIKNVAQTDVNLARHVVDGSKGSGNENIAYGFTSLLKLEQWLDKQSTEEQKLHEFLFNLRKMAVKADELTPAEQEQLRVIQTNKAARVRSEIATRGLNKPIKLYQLANYGGRDLFLDSGVYPDLGTFDFDNRTSSYKNEAGCFVMYQYTYFRGRSYARYSPKDQPQMNSWWNNRLSSLLYGSYYDIVYWLGRIALGLL